MSCSSFICARNLDLEIRKSNHYANWTFLTALMKDLSSASCEIIGRAAGKERFLRVTSSTRLRLFSGTTCDCTGGLLAPALTDSGVNWERSAETEILSSPKEAVSFGGGFIDCPEFDNADELVISAVSSCHSADAFNCSSSADTQAGSYWEDP